MTTKVTVSALHGWPVDVTPVTPDGAKGVTARVAAGETRDFFVHSGSDLLIHEVQPNGVPIPVADLHQGLPVAGYQAQPTSAVDAVNINKAIEERQLRRLDQIAGDEALKADIRWFSIGRTLLEEGWMAINRSIFKPDRVKLPEDAGGAE